MIILMILFKLALIRSFYFSDIQFVLVDCCLLGSFVAMRGVVNSPMNESYLT